MSVRPAAAPRERVVALDYEIVQEQASALGRSGRALEAALAALAEFDCQAEPAGDRARLVQVASDALWRFIVQREACGLRDPRPVIRDYRVPAEVQNRMGAFGRRRGSRAEAEPRRRGAPAGERSA